MKKMNKLLYGVAYYDEYMPYDRLVEDIRMMKAAGMNVVRIGESTWSTMEPQEGHFDTSHLTRVIEAMGEAGISVIIGTPTYAIPAWMAKLHPDVIALTKEGQGLYGHRQNMDITHPAYLFYAERVIRKMMETCAGYPNVIGVQLDNETKAYGTAGPNVQLGFVKYLKDKFKGDLDAMNAAFGLDYWSNRIDAWEDFPDVRGTINGSLGAEFDRYQRKLAADFLMWQRRIVEPYLREDQFITHNTDYNWIGYSYGLRPETDVFENSKALTMTGVDIYHPSQNQLTGMEVGFGGDVARSLKGDNYIVLETQAQGFPEWLPFDGQLRLLAYAHLASGANMVEYWHWHSLHNSFETYWKGVLSQDFKENDTYRSAQQVGREWEKIGAHLVNLRKKNRAAMLVSNTALGAIDWFPIWEKDGKSYKYNDVLMETYRSLYENNIECDFLFPQNAEEKIRNYDLVVIPALYAASEELLRTIEAYVRGGGHVLVTYKSGFADDNNKVWCDETPHILGKVCGISYSHFTLPDQVTLKGEKLPIAGKAQNFMELLEVGTAEVLARYDHPSFGRYAAVTRNHYGEGTATYMGCGLNQEMLGLLVRDAAEEAGIGLPEMQFPLILRSGINEEGKQIRYYLNFSGERQEAVAMEEGTDLLSGRKVAKGEKLLIDPWGVAVLEN